MEERLIDDIVIIGDEVLKVKLLEISGPDIEGRKFRLGIYDLSDKERKKERRGFILSRTFLDIANLEENDLLSLLVQFRNEIPHTVTDKNSGIFRYPDWSRDKKISEIGRVLEVFYERLPNEELDLTCIHYSVTIEYSEIFDIVEFLVGSGVIKWSTTDSDMLRADDGWQDQLRNVYKALA